MTSTRQDITSYIANYEGQAKISRLIFLGERFPDCRVEVGRLLVEELKKGGNVFLYTKFMPKFAEWTGHSEFLVDELWVNTSDQKNTRKNEVLESELSAAKKGMVKEQIRQCHNELGHFFYQIGNLNEALKSFLRSRDFCTTASHNNEMCLNIVEVSLGLCQFFNVTNFLSKVVDTQNDCVLAAKFKIAYGLVALHEGSFRATAHHLLEVSTPLGNAFASVISDEDIGLYATMCALATFSRQELRKYFVDRKTFLNNFTSLIPELKTLALGFIYGKYETCLRTLEALKPRLLMDLHLARHCNSLSKAIVDRLIIQYFSPYNAVDMNRMAKALSMDYVSLESQLSTLIAEGRMPARIDSQSQTLLRTSEDNRVVMIEKVLALTKVHTASLKRDMLRLSLMQHDFMVDSGEGLKSSITRSRGSTPRDGENAGQSSNGGGGNEWSAASSLASNVFNFLGAAGGMVGNVTAVEHQQYNETNMRNDDDGDDHEDYDST